MAIPVKRTAAAPAVGGVNFGDLGFYVSGGGLPEGDYVWTNLEVKLHQAVDQQGNNKGQPRLGVLITMYDRNNPTEEGKHQQFYSMGSKAKLSFMPNDDGSGLLPVPGGPSTTLPDSTNWAALVKSLYDSGLPQGVFTNSVKVFEGMWCHISRVPEPEGRKNFANSSTGEASDEEFSGTRGDGKIPVVTDIPEEGQPWNGTGGLPTAKVAAPVRAAAPKPVAAPAQKVNGKATPAPAMAAEVEGEDLESIMAEAITVVLTAKPNGMARLPLRTETFKVLKASKGEEFAGQAIESVFGDAAALGAILNSLGYGISGPNIKPLE